MGTEGAYVQKCGGNAVMVHYVWWVHFACCFLEQLPLAIASIPRRGSLPPSVSTMDKPGISRCLNPVATAEVRGKGRAMSNISNRERGAGEKNFTLADGCTTIACKLALKGFFQLYI